MRPPRQPRAPPPTAAPATAAPGSTAAARDGSPDGRTATAAPSAAPAGDKQVSFWRNAEAAPVFHTVEAQSNQYMLYYLVFDTLVALDLSDKSLQTLKPRMAESWEISPDATTFTFKLRQDITWQDGTPFTADDVVYTATWTAENRSAFIGFPPAWFAVKDQKVVEKACTDAGGNDPANLSAASTPVCCRASGQVDDFTVEFVLEAPDVFFLRIDGGRAERHPAQASARGPDPRPDQPGRFQEQDPVGTGPFTLNEIVPDQFISFDANPDYYLGRPKLDQLFYKQITVDTALAQLESGELDAVFNAGATNLPRLSSIDILNVQTNEAPGIFTLNPFAETDADAPTGTPGSA